MRGFVTGVVLTLLAIVGGTLVSLYLGKIPLGADNPPGTLERMLANMAMDEYVERNAPKQQNPMQPTAENLIAGARSYEANCSYCHGGAARRVSPMSTKFNPPVPQIINNIPGDPDAHLFWIVKHGIRLTGMPAWDRVLSDQQMWQVVAFVKHSANLPPEVQSAWQQAAAPAANQNQLSGTPPPQ
jgi:mono/diheme cytochrome c family protein